MQVVIPRVIYSTLQQIEAQASLILRSEVLYSQIRIGLLLELALFWLDMILEKGVKAIGICTPTVYFEPLSCTHDSVYTYIYIYTYLFTYLLISLFISLFISFFIYLFIHLYTYTYRCVCQYVYSTSNHIHSYTSVGFKMF